MRFANAALGAAGIAFVAGFGYLLAGWKGALAGFIGFAVGGFVASKQILWKVRAMRGDG
jgi:hypothetical protein